MAAKSEGPAEAAGRRLDHWLEVYRDLHAHPELSGSEERTAGVAAREMAALGLEVTSGVGGHGVVGLLKNGPGPTVLIRGDMDALPIRENSGLDYASTRTAIDGQGREVPLMHACGHDVHTTVLMAAAGALFDLRDQWSGTLVAVAQPAEEALGGAQIMIDDGLYSRFPRPDAGLALHVAPDLACGRVAIRSGAISTGSDNLDLIVRGRPGHGASPHETVDPIVIASQIVLALQTIVSRRVDPLEAAVVTVGTIHGGLKRNAIPDEVRLEMTIRSYDVELRDKMVDHIRTMARGMALAAGLDGGLLPTLERIDDYTPPVVNDPDLFARVRDSLSRQLGPDNVAEARLQTGSEDFSCFHLVEPPVPCVMFDLGAADPDALARAAQGGPPLPTLHTPEFAPPARVTLRTGITALTAAALDLLTTSD